MYVEAILPVPLRHTFTYLVPEELQAMISPGTRLLVPFGQSRKCVALAVKVGFEAPKEDFELKQVIRVLDRNSSVLADQMRLLNWISDYYLCAPGDVMKAMLPAVLRQDTNPEDKPRRRRKVQIEESVLCQEPNELTALQSEALSKINDSFKTKDICLLHGVTSSGKTEVYIHLMKQFIDRGFQVLFMLPEIALTIQITERLKRVFGSELCVYHSRLTDSQRARIWEKQLSDNPYKVVVGARSSVFLPFLRLGLVVIDEEHESSYKQEEPAPRYNGRNVAMILAAFSNAKTLLGSATPSLESYYNARSGRYGLVTMDRRFGNVELPKVEIADVFQLRRKKLMKGLFAPELQQAMREALDRGEQIILFRNRRGYAPQMQCRDCGWMPHCDSCDVGLTYHRKLDRMTCHYCGKVYELPQNCPECGGTHFVSNGYGTEKVEDEIKKLFPAARVSRLDLDTASSQTGYQQILQDFQDGRSDILIGTQMVTKGLDFQRVSLVGILSADSIMGAPDFRASERAFQLMSQVAGRAGRRQNQGRVIIQTRQADAILLDMVRNASYSAFYDNEIKERKLFAYPPYSRIISVYLKCPKESILAEASAFMASSMTEVFGNRVLGPDAPPVSRVSMQYIRKIMLKMECGVDMHPVRQRLLQLKSITEGRFTQVTVFFDSDPM